MSVESAISADAAIGVWHALATALAGKIANGGNVVEIYAYQLVPQVRAPADAKPPVPGSMLGSVVGSVAGSVIDAFFTPKDAGQPAESYGAIAGRNMTRLLRRFAELHEGVVIEISAPGGFRALDLSAEFPPFDGRIHLRVSRPRDVTPASAASIQELRTVVADLESRWGTLSAMIEELAVHRARGRLGADARGSETCDDLPPDGATGLYLDRPFDADDLGWIKMAWGSYLNHGGSSRPTQLMLVFEAIRRDERATAEFLRVMNSIVLPLLRRLALKDRPQLSKLGTASE